MAARRAEIAPLNARRLDLERDIHRLRLEAALHPDDPTCAAALEAEQRELATLRTQLDPLKAEIGQLAQLFWVTKAQVRANKYDLSASRYHTPDREEVYYEDPHVTINRIRQLECAISDGMARIQELLAQ